VALFVLGYHMASSYLPGEVIVRHTLALYFRDLGREQRGRGQAPG